jgi:hypothetical protein
MFLKSLLDITRAESVQALELYERSLCSATWTLYRVRRIYAAKGRADRALEQLAQFGDRHQDARQALHFRARKDSADVRNDVESFSVFVLPRQ